MPSGPRVAPVSVVVGSCGERFQCGVTGRFTSRDNNPSKRPRVVPSSRDTPVRPVRALTTQESVLVSNVMMGSVNSDTRKEYMGGWKIWEDFADGHGFDVYLRGYDDTGRVGAVCLLIATLGTQGNTPRVVKMAVRSIRFFFDVNMIGSRFLDDVTIVRTKRSVKPVGRSAFDQRTSVERQAVTLDMVQWSREKCLVQSKTLEDMMSYVAFSLAFNFMWRASEYIVVGSRTTSDNCVHALKRGDVVCYDQSGTVIPTSAIHGCKDVAIVKSVTFVIKSSKADQGGQGRFLSLDRGGILQNQLVDDLVHFLRDSKTTDDDYLMSRWKNGRNLKLTRKVLTGLLKAAAAAKGLPGACFALHSLRIGGATQMAASSSDSGMIDRVGGWTSGNSVNKSARYRRGTTLDHGALGSIDKGGKGTVVRSDHIRKMVRVSKH